MITNTSVDFFRTNKDGSRKLIAKNLKNANSYNERISCLEDTFGIARNESYHKPMKNFECFQKDSTGAGTSNKTWGSHKLVSADVVNHVTTSPGFDQASTDDLTTKYGSTNSRRSLWFIIGRGGQAINTITDQIQGTYNFSTTLYNCIPFRLVDRINDLTEAEKRKYGLCVKLTFANNVIKYAFYNKLIDNFTRNVVSSNNDFIPEQADKNVTDTVYVEPANIMSKSVSVSITITGKIDENEVIEYFSFINATNQGSFVNEIGIVRSTVMKMPTEDGTTWLPACNWNDAELFTHLESNRFDFSGGKSAVDFNYTFYFN